LSIRLGLRLELGLGLPFVFTMFLQSLLAYCILILLVRYWTSRCQEMVEYKRFQIQRSIDGSVATALLLGF